MKYPIDVNYPKPETGAGITRVYKQPVPAMRFVGKNYGTGNGDWGEFWGNDWFTKIEEAAGLDNVRALYEDNDAYCDLYAINPDGSRHWWIGMFVPAGSSVPDGLDYHDFDAGFLGVCWIYGTESTVFGKIGKCLELLTQNGMNVKPDADGVIWHFDRAQCPRFTTPDEDGNITLDYCYYVG